MLSAGILLANFHNLWLPIIIALCAISAIVFRLYYISALIATLLAANILASATESHGAPLPASIASYHAVVSRSSANSNSQTLYLIVDSCNSVPISPTKVTVNISGGDTDFHRADALTFKAKFTPISSRHDLPLEFNHTDYLLAQGFKYSAFITNSDITSTATPHSFRRWLEETSRSFTTALFRTPLNPDTKIFLNTLFTGDTTTLTPDTRATFAQAGLAHILALSGMHVSLIAFIISFALSPLSLFYRKIPATIITLLFLWLFAIATGLSPSVVRAVIMATVYSLARIFGRQSSPLNSLCLAAIVILIISPQAIYAPGFQLSFAAVISIILFAEKLNPVSRHHPILYTFASLITVSLSAMIGTGLLSVIYFGSFPLYFLAANIPTALLLPPLMIGGLLSLVLNTFGLDLHIIYTLTNYLYVAVHSIALKAASLPGASIDNLFIPAWVAIPYAAALIMLRAAFHSHRYLWLSGAAITCIATALIFSFIYPIPIEPTVYFAHNRNHTTAIIPNKATKSLNILVLSTAPQSVDIPDISTSPYRTYALARGLDSITSTIYTKADKFQLALNKAIASNKLAVVNSAEALAHSLANDSIDYIIVARGISSYPENLTPSKATVILDSSLSTPRANKLYQLLTSKHINTINLITTTFSISTQ